MKKVVLSSNYIYPTAMNDNLPLVYIIDDDQAVRESLQWLLESINLKVKTYDNGEAFLANELPDAPGCAILDVRMPNISGMEILEKLCKQYPHIAFIMVTGHADVAMATRAMKLGAFDFFEKPYNDQALVDCVQDALRSTTSSHQRDYWLSEVQERLNALSCRENDVLQLIIEGHPNKVIARELSLSVKTVEAHRAKLMQKMQANSLAELLRMVYQGKP